MCFRAQMNDFSQKNPTAPRRRLFEPSGIEPVLRHQSDGCSRAAAHAAAERKLASRLLYALRVFRGQPIARGVLWCAQWTHA